MIEIQHIQEWLASYVDLSLIFLNVLSLSGDHAYDYLLYGLPTTERRNDGRLRDKWLSRYSHLSSGGWWVSGLDPLNNWLPNDWGRFKPDQPRLDWEKGKQIKYESPPKVPNRVTYFNVPPHIWDKVASRYGISRYHSPLALRLQDRSDPVCFWEWVQKHPEIPIILTEGEKKAACLLSMGFVAIALPGIWNGRVGKKDFNETLHPDLVPMAQPGRKLIICFDYETKPKTRYALYQAQVRTGRAIEAAGCDCEVASLPGPEKGVDDFVAARGQKADRLLEAILSDALTLKDYQHRYRLRRRGLSQKYRPHLTVNIPYLSEAVRLPESGLVALWSDMGTGKTELLRQWRSEHPSARFLNNGHRVNLLKNLAKRLQTEIYSALNHGHLAKANALSITVDSLYKLNTQANIYDCIFIDEACQYLAHLLHSQTCKEHRAEILEVLEYLVGKAKLVVLADAHMDDITVDFFRAMRPPSEQPFIIKNEFKNGGRPIFWYEGQDSSALVAQIFAALMVGQKVMVVSDSKRFIKKLEAAMTIQNSKVKIHSSESDGVTSEAESPTISNLQSPISNPMRVWSIHAENSGSAENVAFIKDISSEVKNLDALLASPSLGTGVDIPNYHFDLVFGAFHAVSQTATECAQALHRYRPKVPMHIWVAPRPPYGYQETNATKIRERMLESNEMTAFLIRIDRETGRRGAEKDWALDAYCQIQAARHQSINNLRSDLRALLEEMGHQIIPLGEEKDSAASKQLSDAAKALDLARAVAVARASSITRSEYLARQSLDYLTPEEVFECEKFRISRAYGLPVTEELVKRDDGGRLIRQLAALEAILAPSEGTSADPRTGKTYPTPPQMVVERDLTERDILPLCMDWGNYSAKWLARYILGLPPILRRLIAGEEVCASDPDLLRMREIAVSCAAHVKAILGFSVPTECQPIWLLGVLVNQLGLRLISRKQGARRQQVRFYRLAVEELEFALTVLAHREQQRQEKAAREREEKEKLAQYQMLRQSLYGLSPPKAPVSTPPEKRETILLSEGVDTKNSGSQNQEERDPEGFETDPNWIQACAQLLLEAMEYGTETIKEILQPWTVALRWRAWLRLGEYSLEKMRRLLAMTPNMLSSEGI